MIRPITDAVSGVAIEEGRHEVPPGAMANSSGSTSNGQPASHLRQLTELVKIENISKISISKEDDFTYIVTILPTVRFSRSRSSFSSRWLIGSGIGELI